MKLETIIDAIEVSETKKTIVISCHGVTYTISSAFEGIRITNDHFKGIRTHATDEKNSIVIS